MAKKRIGNFKQFLNEQNYAIFKMNIRKGNEKDESVVEYEEDE